ncbi:MAG: isoprenylcysteine carboxylmethyltransferase family protein, partial [Acidobacteriota bacterium]
MGRTLILIYGVFVYGIFLVTFMYAVGFVGGLIVPKSIDTGPTVSPAGALLLDALLLGLFAVQHSTMARPWFKKRWTRIVPAPAERSTFVLFTSLILILL